MPSESEISARKNALAVVWLHLGEILAGRSTVAASLKSWNRTDFGRTFIRYFVVGGICALTDWVVFPIFLYGADFHYLIAGTISFVIATGLNYVLSVRYVFDAGGRARHTEVLLVYAASAVGLLINLAALGALIELVGIHPMIAKILGTGSAFAWNFCARYYWIFNR